jgi:predicted HAD superfamily Cof-like phosphohydrolase
MIHLVQEFHNKFGLPLGVYDELSGDADATEFRVKFMSEELTEFHDAMKVKDRVKAFDALLDLAYVVYGTALFLGIEPSRWHKGMSAVHKANMQKIRVASAAESKRGSAWDVKKPVGWTGPESQLEEILK